MRYLQSNGLARECLHEDLHGSGFIAFPLLKLIQDLNLNISPESLTKLFEGVLPTASSS